MALPLPILTSLKCPSYLRLVVSQRIKNGSHSLLVHHNSSHRKLPRRQSLWQRRPKKRRKPSYCRQIGRHLKVALKMKSNAATLVLELL